MAKLSPAARRHVNQARAMALLAANLAEAVEDLIEHLGERVASLDGAPAAQTYDGMPRGEADNEALRPVESVGVARAKLITDVEQILDDVLSIRQLIDDTTTLVAKLSGRPQVVMQMCTGGLGRPGWSDWGADSCDRAAVTADRELCDRHRVAEYRWRRHADEEAATA